MTKTIGLAVITLVLSLILYVIPISAQSRFISGDLQGPGATGDFSMETLNEDLSQTRVMVNLNGFSANTMHPTFIRLGDCKNPGPARFELDTITTDENNRGSSTTVVDERLESFEDGNHVIAVHHDPSVGSNGVIACGEIPNSKSG